MYEAKRKDFDDWFVRGEYKKINGYDIIICEKTHLKYHIDINTLVKVA